MGLHIKLKIITSNIKFNLKKLLLKRQIEISKIFIVNLYSFYIVCIQLFPIINIFKKESFI